MAVAPRRRGRRTRVVLLAVVLSVLVLLVNTAVSARSRAPARRLAELTYLDLVRPHVARSTEQGADLGQVRTDAVRLGRAGVKRRLQRVTEDARAVLRALHAVDPPQTLATAHSLLLATAAMRERAAEQVRDALVQVLGTDPPEPAIARLASAGADIAAADQAYRVFLESLPAARDVRGGAMPPSAWFRQDQPWTAPELEVFVRALRSATTLAPVHDVALVVLTTDPAPVRSEGAAAVLPALKTLRLQVVVANTGNEPERRVPVAATLATAETSDTAREFVDLAPGQRQTVTLRGLVPVAGAAATLTVTVGPVPGETAVGDNTRAMPLIVR